VTVTTIEDLMRTLSDHGRMVVPAGVPGTVISGVVPWEPSRSYPPGVALLGMGVAAQPLFEQGCVAVVLRDPGADDTRSAWQREARQRGVALLLLDADASWPSVLSAVAELTVTADTSPANGDAFGQIPPGDLFALADAFAGMVGGPVIIEDADFRVLSYSSFIGPMDQGRNIAILGRHIPPEWRSYLEESGSLERLRKSDDVVDLASGPWQAHRRLITAVRASGQVLGIIWAAEGDQPLPAHAAAALGRAARLAVPHLRRYQDERQAERTVRGGLVRSLLDGRGLLHRHATELGLPRDATLAVLAFAPMSEHVLSDDIWDRITDHVALSCEAFRWHAAVARVGEFVFAVLALPDDHPPDGALRLGRDIVGRSVPALRDTLCGAMSTTGPELARIRQRRLEAQDAVGIVRSGRCAEPFVTYQAVQPQIILRELGQTLIQREDLRLPGLTRLTEEDVQRRSEFVATLRAYLRCGGQAAAAARELGIHVTTMRYRLGRITEVSGLDLRDPEVRLVCQLLIDMPFAPHRTH
jgi:hypothetical protein